MNCWVQVVDWMLVIMIGSVFCTTISACLFIVAWRITVLYSHTLSLPSQHGVFVLAFLFVYWYLLFYLMQLFKASIRRSTFFVFQSHITRIIHRYDLFRIIFYVLPTTNSGLDHTLLLKIINLKIFLVQVSLLVIRDLFTTINSIFSRGTLFVVFTFRPTFTCNKRCASGIILCVAHNILSILE